MTAPDDVPSPTTAAPTSAEEQAELDAYLAAEEVANDYHEDDLPPD